MTERKLQKFQSVESFTSDGFEIDIVDTYTIDGVYEPTRAEKRWSKIKSYIWWKIVLPWEKLSRYFKRLGLALIGRDLEYWHD